MKIDFSKMTTEEIQNWIKNSLQKQKKVLAEHGFDIGKHWEEMTDTLKKS